MRLAACLGFGLTLGCAATATAEPLTFIEGRTFTSTHGFLLVIPPGVAACRGGWTDHGFFLFLGPNPPCVPARATDDGKVPLVVEVAPEESIPYIQFSYSWNAAFSPESAWELVEKFCKDKKYRERREETYGSQIYVSQFRFLGQPGVECLQKYRPTGRISLMVRFHPFALGSDAPDTDDEGYIVPYGRYVVTLVTTRRDFQKHRRMLERVVSAISRPPRPESPNRQ
jgi:hypothetical protein